MSEGGGPNEAVVYTSAGGGCCGFVMSLSALVVAVLAFQMAKENQQVLINEGYLSAASPTAGPNYLWRFMVALLTVYFMMNDGGGAGRGIKNEKAQE